MPKPRGGTSYRLSDDAKEILAKLSSRLGITKTSVLEMAVRKLAYAELDEMTPRNRKRSSNRKENVMVQEPNH